MKHQFIGNITLLTFATGLSQLLLLIISPVLTRLYTPEEFGLFALYLAVLGVITPLICGKYEVALVIPKNRKHVDYILSLALSYAIVISTMVLIGTAIFGGYLIDLWDTSLSLVWLLYLPLGTLFTGVAMALRYYSNASDDYYSIGIATILFAVSTAAISIIAGIIGLGDDGLIIAHLSGLILSALYYLAKQRRKLVLRLFNWDSKSRYLAHKYRTFPLFNSTSSMLNSFQQMMPVFFLGGYFTEAIVGIYALVMRVIAGPLSVVSESVAQANLRRVTQLINNHMSVKSPILVLLVILALFGTLVGVVLTPYAPELFAFVFGEQWRLSGELLQILIPALIIRFVASSLSSTLSATLNNRLAAATKIILFSVTLLFFTLFGAGLTFKELMSDYAIIMSANYLLVIGVVLYVIYQQDRRVSQ